MNTRSLPVLAMHHVSIAVPDLDAAVAWYSDIFGLRGAFLRRSGVRLELWQSLSLPADPAARRASRMDLKVIGTKHLAFVVPDLPAAQAPGKPRLFAAFVADPFGTAIEMIDGAQVGDGV